MRSTIALIVLLAANVTIEADENIEFFERKIRPLFVKHCYRCHSADAKRLRGGLRLDGRDSILKGGDSGPAIVAKLPEQSLLIKAIRYGDAKLQMPPTGKLSKRNIALLEEWVRRGVPYPKSAKNAVPQTESIDIAAGKAFWSFQPVIRHRAPAVRKRDWPKRRIDMFVLAKLEELDLSPTAPAERRQLIRRAYFDLTGLPPSPDEVKSFVADKSPDAYAALIERLLASPHYGERWGRYWLDLTRYCDIAESWAESKGQAYLYRDWVVRALNDDMPFDRFVTLQLAADLADEHPKHRAALGFLGRSPSYWKELKLDHNVIKEVVAEEWEERIEAVTRTFLGLTVACARCHDHKFDPITTKDYYALAGVFASTKLVDRALLPDETAAIVEKAQSKVRELQKQVKVLQRQKTDEAKAKFEKLTKQIADIKNATPHFDAPLVPAVEDASLFVTPDGPYQTKLVYKHGMARDVRVQRRGSPTKLGPVVPRRFLSVLSPSEPKPFTRGSGRLELAQAMVTDGAPLTARVIVNRVWMHHFGTGIVATPSNFGKNGARPTHPQLLDDLAVRFIKSGWSLKWLHREIMLSATYQQASSFDAKKHAVDPDNRWLWRMNRRRLEIEAWRDAMLAATGRLDATIGGAPSKLNNAGNRRRTLYGVVKRRELSDILRLHDFPDPTNHSPNRVPTMTPLQQLFTLNSPFMQRQSTALVERLKRDESAETGDRVRRAYWLLFGRSPTDGEMRLATAFLGANAANDTLWRQYAQVLLGSNEFLFVD